VLAASPDRPLLRQLQASCRTAANRRCVPEPDSCGAEEPIALFDDLVGAAGSDCIALGRTSASRVPYLLSCSSSAKKSQAVQ
jgi:hypothetical protein